MPIFTARHGEHLNAIFDCSRYARAGEATDFNLVKNQSQLNVVQLPSASARTKADRKRSD